MGSLVGAALAVAMTAVAFATLGPLTPLAGAATMSVGLILDTMLASWGAIATFSIAGTLAAAPIAGLIKGGNSRKAEMEVEYSHAEHFHQAQEYQNSKAKQTSPERGKAPKIEHELPQRTQSWQQEQGQRTANTSLTSAQAYR